MSKISLSFEELTLLISDGGRFHHRNVPYHIFKNRNYMYYLTNKHKNPYHPDSMVFSTLRKIDVSLTTNRAICDFWWYHTVNMAHIHNKGLNLLQLKIFKKLYKI